MKVWKTWSFLCCVILETSAITCKGRFYTLSEYSDERTRDNANTQCINNDGTLASIPDAETQNNLTAEAGKKWGSGTIFTYLGGRRASNQLSFQWPDGTVFARRDATTTKVWTNVGYTAWKDGVKESGKCVLLIRESNVWGWHAGSCFSNHNYICENKETRNISFTQSSYSARIGESTTISGTISGFHTEPLTVSAIYNNNQRVTLATNYIGSSFSYTISSVKSSHIGNIQIELVGSNTSCKTIATVNLQLTTSLQLSLEKSETWASYGLQQVVTCTADGYANPSVEWFRKGALVTTSSSSNIYQSTSQPNTYTGKSLLYITVRDVTESGSYVCEATNWNRDGEKTKTIQVKVAANITTTYASMNVTFGLTKFVDCISFGFPTPTVTWKRGTETISTDSSRSVHQTTLTSSGEFDRRIRLSIKMDDYAHSGQYQCQASNGYESNRNTDLTVYVPANISVTKQTIKLEHGVKQTVDCTSYGYPKPNVNWFSLRSGSQVSYSISSSIYQQISWQGTYHRTNRLHLTITDVTQSGIYECRVQSNAAGNGKVQALTANVLPNITLSTPTVVAETSQSYQVDCISYGFPKPTVVWKRDENVISDSSTYSIHSSLISESEYSQKVRLHLNIDNVVDSGSYVCQATNSDGDTKQTDLDVKVPANISLLMTKKVVTIPESFTVVCDSYGFPRPIVKWKRTSRSVGSSFTISVDQRASTSGAYKATSQLNLNINSIQQAGKYVCEASNIKSVTTTFQALVKANVSLSNNLVSVRESRLTNINCTSYGYSTPEVYWARYAKNVSTVFSTDVYQAITRVNDLKVVSVLYFQRSSLSYAGEYVCHARNSEEGSATTATAQVQVGPYFVSSNSPEHFSQSQTFTCMFAGNPPPTVHWKINNKTIDEQIATPTKITSIKRSNETESKLILFSTIIFGPNSSVSCWSNNSISKSAQKTMSLNSDLQRYMDTYYTTSTTPLSYGLAADSCKGIGGYLPVFENLGAGFPNKAWLQNWNKNNTGTESNNCTVYRRNRNMTKACTKESSYICVYLALEIVQTSKCYGDRVSVEWKDMTGNNESVTYLIRAVNKTHSINVSKINTQVSSGNHIYNSNIENLKPDISYTVSLQLFPGVWSLNVPTSSAMTSSVFVGARGQMSLNSGTCYIEVSIPDNVTNEITRVELRFVKLPVGPTNARMLNWTEITFSPNASMKHSVPIGGNEKLVAQFQPITDACPNTILNVSGECKVELNQVPPSNASAVAGVVVPLLLLIALVAAAVFYRDRIQGWIQSRNVFTNASSPAHTGSNPVAGNPAPGQSTKIMKFLLGGFYIDSAKNEHEALKVQFEKVKTESKNFSTVYFDATAQDNTGKNRYKNIVPYDNNRVMLGGADGKRYINASYVEGFNQPNKWIATQGPIVRTVEDFWTMVFEQNVRVIVMLANLYEKGKSKCAHYWPEKTRRNKVFSRVKVDVVDVINKGSYVIRQMTIEEVNSPYATDRVVTQFHFTAWPDHGVPQTTTGLLRFSEEVKKHLGDVHQSLNVEVPVIVHCSAGAGRTGTFIGFNNLIEELSETGSVDVFKAVRHMREQRMEMVQTPEQYIFLHKLLAETVSFNETDLDLDQLNQKFLQTKRFARSNEISKEFHDLNRFGDDVIVSPLVIAGSSSVSYSANGQQKKKGVYKIETYNPLDSILIGNEPPSGEVEDFLNVVFEENTGFILQLHQAGKTLLWPDILNRETRQGKFVITFVEEKKHENLNGKKITLENVDLQQTKEVVLLMFGEWSDNGVPRKESDFVSLVSFLESLQVPKTLSNILVLTRSKLSKSVVFAAVWNLVARYKAEKKVDVFRTVKDINSCLPETALSVAQYKSCYSLIKAYIDTCEVGFW